MSAPLYVVDVCNTLVREDTTVGLLLHHFSRQRRKIWRATAVRIMVSRRSPVRWAWTALERLTGRHLLKHVLVSLLSGDRTGALEQSAAEYADVLLQERKVQVVWRVLEPALRSGRLVLASSSLEPVVAALAARLGARYVASELEEREGVLTGRYLRDLTGNKVSALAGLLAGDLAHGYVAISDNLSDRLLLAEATERYVVLGRDRHRKRWGDLPAHYLRVS